MNSKSRSSPSPYRLDIDALEDCWERAAEPRPTVILGAGRWGRVLADVAAAATDRAAPIGLVARSNLAETKAWQQENFPLRGSMTVAASIDEVLGAMAIAGDRAIAIVASRPRDHAADARTALRFKLPVLVEKPLSDDPDTARAVLGEAAVGGVPIGLGVEFGVLPALHFLAGQLGALAEDVAEIGLTWQEPAREVRYGATKNRHDEIDTLGDLLPHALSIFRVFAPEGRWHMNVATLAEGGVGGQFRLAGPAGLVANLLCGTGNGRIRRLEIRSRRAVVATMDFADRPVINLADRSLIIPRRWQRLGSTLRLARGSFLAGIATGGSPLMTNVDEFPRLHAELRTKLAHPRAL